MSEQRPMFNFTPRERLEYEQTVLRQIFVSLVESVMEETGIPAKEVAARMGKSKAWVSKLLSGRHNPTVDTMAELALALGLRWDVALQVADRTGTRAEADPEPPTWVRRANQPLTSATAFGGIELTPVRVSADYRYVVTQPMNVVLTGTVYGALPRSAGFVFDDEVRTVTVTSHFGGASVADSPNVEETPMTVKVTP